MIYVLLILVLFAAIAELTIALTYNHKIREYVALVSQIEEAEKRLRDINEMVPPYMTAAYLENMADYVDWAFAAYLCYVPGDDPEKENMLNAQYFAVNIIRHLAARRREEIKQ